MEKTSLGIDEIFQAALGKNPADQKEYLNHACNGDARLRARVERLLIAHANGKDSFLDSPPSGLGAKEVAEIPATMAHTSEQLGGQIGPYKLLQKLGEGGMGTVYMAEQKKPVARRVALKIIKPGMDSGQVIARFEAERQALAMMDHPNIAKVFDAGATNLGRPYFVMELVKGIPITQYCDENHLPTKQRLGLFVEVCHAVQHAHQKGIIHRDLKPQNVLVADYDHKPVPKVIDFGIAKAITQSLTEKTIFTEIGQIVGTIEYMSPEQAKLNQLDVDTRTDVYSLGVLLYQLLTGVTPIESKRLRSAGFEEMLRIIREEEPPKPSTRISSWGASAKSLSDSRRTTMQSLKKMVQGDLDWIVMKAIEKDRARRYDTANAFADDVQRYLSDELVSARPPSAMYRTSKFVRRNKGTLAVAGAVILLIGLSAMGFRIMSEQAKNIAANAKNMAENAKRQSEQDLQKKEQANTEMNAMLDVIRVMEASQESIAQYLDKLPPNLYAANARLQEVAEQKPHDSNDKSRLNAQLALVKRGDNTFVQPLLESLLTETAGYVKVIRDVLEPHKGLGSIEEQLWKSLKNNTPDENGVKRRFRAGLALAAYAPDSPKWNDEQRAFMATQILVERPVDQAIYLSQIKPIAKFCIPTWKEIFKGNDVLFQGSAAYALEYFAGGELLPQKDIAELLAVASPKQFQILFPLIKRPADSSFIAQLQSLAATPPSEDTKTEDRVKFGQARAGAGITLLRMGEHRAGLDMFRMESDLENQKRAVDPEALAQFVHRSRDRGVTAEVVADCLKSLDSHDTLVTTSKDAARYALLLALSEYPVEEVAPKLLEKLVSQAGDWYRNDPRSSVHGAARWLLHKWGRIDVVKNIDHTSIPYSPSREWFTRTFRAKDGHATYMTFIVFRGGEFTIGSPIDEDMRDNRETRHQVRITRPYALADREVTKEEITAFSEQEGIPVKQFPGAPGFAGPGLTWYEAVRFCRWLTKQDGMTEGNQPYPAADAIEVKDLPKVPGLTLSTPRDWPLHVERTGYRLPTEQEWEVAARSGVLTRYFYGGDRDLLLDYAWLGANSKREPHEPKTRMPNLRGMFDMHGNMFEWCHDWIGDYLQDEVLDDWTGQEYGDRRVLRGGCWGITHQFCRNSLRMSHDPTTPFPFIGFRVAMTLPTDKEFAREALLKNEAGSLSTLR